MLQVLLPFQDGACSRDSAKLSRCPRQAQSQGRRLSHPVSSGGHSPDWVAEGGGGLSCLAGKSGELPRSKSLSNTGRLPLSLPRETRSFTQPSAWSSQVT